MTYVFRIRVPFVVSHHVVLLMDLAPYDRARNTGTASRYCPRRDSHVECLGSQKDGPHFSANAKGKDSPL